MAEVKRGFAAPEEVVSYFRDKGLKPGFSWQDVWGAEHAHAFTVAKATELDLLTAFKSSIDKAIVDGKGFERWKQDIVPELQRLGWYGPRRVADPAGQFQDTLVDFSSSRRLQTIFHSNMASARAAGQWQRAQRSKAALPYFLYVRTSSTDPRPEHLSFVGVILPVDHPWWGTHFPPNGWLCKCTVRQITKREAGKLLDQTDGAVRHVSEPPDLGPPRRFVNKRTGEVTEVPVGIDPGWQTNPGQARATTLMDNLESRLGAAPEKVATKALQDLWSDPYLASSLDLPDKSWIPAGVSKDLADRLNAKSAVVSIPTDVIKPRIVRHRLTIGDFSVLPSVIAEGTIVPDRRGDEGTRGIILQIGKTWWRCFVKVSENGFLRVNSLHQRDAAAAEREIRSAGK